MNVSENLIKKSGSQREVIDWINLCRVVAIYGVVLIHTCGAFFYQYGAIPLIDWLSANFLDSLMRCTVPLFVMLSGALLLKPGAQLVPPFKLAQRISKVLFPLIVWSFIYLLHVSRHSEVPVNWLSILKQPAMYHLWFVYMIIGIYIFIPVFQAIFETIRNKRNFQLYLLGIWLVVTCLPVYWPLPILTLLQQNSFFGYGGYFLIGAVIASSPKDRIPTAIWILIFVISVLVTFGLTWRFSEQARAPIEKAYLYFSLNVFVSAIAAFVLFKLVKVPKCYTKSLQWVSDRSFLIYFVHVLVLEYVRYSNLVSVLSQHVPVFLTILIISIATFIISLMIAAVIRVIPGSQRVFG